MQNLLPGFWRQLVVSSALTLTGLFAAQAQAPTASRAAALAATELAEDGTPFLIRLPARQNGKPLPPTRSRCCASNWP